MSLLNKASLIQIPSGYKDGTLYSAKPTNGDGDFTFSRGSNLAATRVNSEGLIEKGRENLLLQSNTFDTTWTNNLGASGTIADNQSGYDGSNDAWLLTKDATTFARVQQTLDTPISGVWTMSAYLKSGTATVSRFRFNSPDYMVEFNFSTGVATDEGSVSAIDYGMTNVGNDWYRCYATFNASVSVAQIYVDYNTSTSTTMFVQDAQVEQGLVATDYIETTTTTEQAGILEDMPRLDYSSGASCGHLLLEPQRSNLITHSEYLEGGFSLASNATISIENVTTPDGGNVVTKCQANLGSDSGRVQDNIQIQGNNFVISGFFKGTGDATRLRFRCNQGSAIAYDIDTSGNFTLFSEDAANDNYGIEDFGNGWYRIYFETTTSGSTDNYVQIYPDFLDGDGSVYAWGIQAEEGSYPTSYIPTYGGGSSVTRSADDCQIDDLQSNGIVGNNWTYFFEWGDYVAERNFEMKNSSNTDFLFMVSRMFRYKNNVGGVYTLTTLPSGVNEGIKVAVRYDGSSLKVFRSDDVINEVTDMNASLFDDFDFLRLDRGFDDSEELRQLLIFPTALTDAECEQLTTI